MDRVEKKEMGSEYVHLHNCELMEIESKICLISN